MARPVGFLALAAAAVVAVWWWLGTPIAMPHAPMAAGDKLNCVSYAPFRDSQSPLDGVMTVPAVQIDEDLARLAKISRCVRTYSTDFGLDQIAALAGKHGLKVIQGLWLSSNRDKNRDQIETAVALANRHPDVIEAVVVGNEVLLRGELGVADVVAALREVKSRVPMPVTYADVWEFWLRNPQLFDAVDFITIHILPYWEDFPIPARHAAAHVDEIRRKVAAALPGKDILIGEVGWPSAGRMREGALPSPANEAQVVQDVVALAKRANYRVNIIEAFDQPWKRRLEGTVGGHWGILDNETRAPKFVWGEAVSNHPRWLWQATFGVVLVAVTFAAALVTARRRSQTLSTVDWAAIALATATGGVLSGWALAAAPLESLGLGGWIRSAALCAVAILAAPLSAAAIAARMPAPGFADILADARRSQPWLTFGYGLVLIVTTALAIQVALGLVFDPRYKDFPFAALTAAAVPFLLHGLCVRAAGTRGIAETVAAAMLALGVVYIAPNEGFANWQSLWLCGALLLVAVTLLRVRGAQS